MSLEHSPMKSDKAARSVREFCDEAGVSHTTLYAEIRRGRVEARKCGAKTLIITPPSEWLAKLPALSAPEAA